MKLINEIVKHNTFGKGRIFKQTDSYVSVVFDESQKVIEFQYPEAFSKYIELNNKILMEEITILLEKEKKKIESLYVEKEKTKANEQISKKNIKVQTMKNTSKKDSNVAFKCNYCDGGKSKTSIGFEGVCSDDTIKYNINVEKHIWCSNLDSDCYRYLNREISRKELNSIYRETGSVCYESKMLREWEASAGVYHNGINKGKPMILRNASSNSLAILTTRLPYEQEIDRIIFALFLVNENYEGDSTEEGYVKSHPLYRIKLSIEEAKKVKFWDYYYNRNKPETIKLGSGLHRYLSDIQAAQIIKKISEIKKGTSEEKHAIDLLEHYCSLKNIDVNQIPESNGALVTK